MYYPPAYDPVREYYFREEKKTIRQNAERVGIVLLIAVGLQFVAVFFDIVLGLLLGSSGESSLSEIAQNKGMVYSTLLTMVEYIVYMGAPVLVGWLLFRRRNVKIVPLKKTDGSFGMGLVLLGLGMMVIANIIGSYILTVLEMVGITPAEIPEMQDGTVPVLLLNIVSVGILPGIFEELLFRGVILQGMRPAGDVAALVCSSLMFGLMHGTLYQIPFAFILGLVFGYIVLKTGNILWSMGLHIANNTLSVLMEYWLWNVSDEAANKWYLLFFGIEAFLGVIGAAVLMMRSHPRVTPVGDRISSWMTEKQRRRALYTAGTVIAFIVIMALITVAGMEFAGINGIGDTNDNDAPPISSQEEQQSARLFTEVLR